VSRNKAIDFKVAFGRVIRRFRLEKGLSQEGLAERAGIHRTYIGDVERGVRNISLANMMRLAYALNIPLSQIVAEMERNQ
jgi:transcriptional regulator with XRE-family HTH domain